MTLQSQSHSKQEFLTSFRRSEMLQRIAEEVPRLRQLSKSDPRKIIPVAEVARWLEVSIRQMWKWIGLGWLSTYQRSSELYRKGISKPGFTRFLNRLVEQQKKAVLFVRPVTRGRPAAARQRLREAYRNKEIADGMTPTECAATIGISTDSVIRAFRCGAVETFKPSAHRYRLGSRLKISHSKRETS